MEVSCNNHCHKKYQRTYRESINSTGKSYNNYVEDFSDKVTDLI